MKQSHYLPILLAGLLAAAGAQAQTISPSGSSDLPPASGEASTQTQGAPNVETTNSPVTEAPAPSKDALRQEAQALGATAAPTSDVPPKAGEASTFVQGKPNIDPNMPAAKSRADVVAELLGRPAAFEAMRQAMLASGTTRVGMLTPPAQ